MQIKVITLERFEAWAPEIVPDGAKILYSRFVFVLKRTADGVIE